MTTVVVSTQESKVTAVAAESKVTASGTAVNVVLSPPGAPQLTVEAAVASTVAVSAAPASVAVQHPSDVTVEILSSTVSGNKILDLVRLDASDLTLVKQNGKIVRVEREGYVKTILRDQSGTLSGLVVTTNTGSITKTLVYNSDGLAGYTVT